MKALFQTYVDDKSSNALLRDLGVASLFLTIGFLLESYVFFTNPVFQSLIGVCIGFALGFAIRSVIVWRAAQKQ
jgi:hypothetical protein